MRTKAHITITPTGGWPYKAQVMRGKWTLTAYGNTYQEALAKLCEHAKGLPLTSERIFGKKK